MNQCSDWYERQTERLMINDQQRIAGGVGQADMAAVSAVAPDESP